MGGLVEGSESEDEPTLPGITLNQYNQTLVHAKLNTFLSVEMVHALEQYTPGASKKMLKMAEIGQQAMISSNQDAMTRTQSDVRWAQILNLAGQVMLFFSIMASLVASLYSIKIGASPIVSCALAGWPVAKGIQEIFGRFRGDADTKA